MDIERAIIEKSYAKLKEATGYLCDDKENDYDCALDELYNAAIARQSVTSEEVAEAIEYYRHIADITKGEESLAETSANLAITALQSYQPFVSTSNNLPECKWVAVKNGRGGHECSFCYKYAPSYQDGTEWLSCYCPNCGCKLDGE